MIFQEILFPKFCLGCGFFGKYICTSCQKQLFINYKDYCLYCGRASYLGLTHPACERKLGVDGIICAYRYNNLMKKMVKTIKYRLASDVLRELFDLVPPTTFIKLQQIADISSPLFWQEIPLHSNKFRQRGFNQAELIGELLQKRLKIEKTNSLFRKKDTFAQAQLKKDVDRVKNMRGAFELKKEVPGNILLIDDVVTTGSTIKEAARAIKKISKGKTYVFALAKG